MRDYLVTLLVTAAVTYLLTGPVRKFAIAAGAMPAVRARDVHREPTPRLGGIAMFGGLCAGLLVASQLPQVHTVFEDTSDATAMLSGAALVWGIGVVDDKWGLDALIKLGGQMVAAGVMVLQGLVILYLPIPGVGTVALSPVQGTLLTVVLVVLTANAVNFVDGLDGLAGGMVCIAALAFFVYSYRLWYGYGLEVVAPATLFSAILIGVCVGFLPHNLHPARIFMGDSGALLLGLMLSVPSVSLAGQVDPDSLAVHTSSSAATYKLVPLYLPLVLPLTMIAIPVADLVMAIVRRTLAGRSPFSADRKHLHHRLLDLGHSHSRAVLVLYFWSAVICFGTVAMSVQPGKRPVVLGVVALCAVGVGAMLLPRFQPRAPDWLERFLPPRYRRQHAVGDAETPAVEGSDKAQDAETRGAAPESGQRAEQEPRHPQAG